MSSRIAIVFAVLAQASAFGAGFNLDGYDGKEPCRLYVHREWWEGAAGDVRAYRAEISTSYEHGHDGLGHQVVSFSRSDGGTLAWEDRAGQFIRINLRGTGFTASEASAFRIHWMHDGHPHDDTCSNLR